MSLEKFPQQYLPTAHWVALLPFLLGPFLSDVRARSRSAHRPRCALPPKLRVDAPRRILEA